MKYKFNHKEIDSRIGYKKWGIPAGDVIPVNAGDIIERDKKGIVCPVSGQLDVRNIDYPLWRDERSREKISPSYFEVKDGVATCKKSGVYIVGGAKIREK